MKTWWRRSFSPPLPDADGRRGSNPDEGGTNRADLVDAHVHVFPPDMIRERHAYLERDDRFAALYRSPSARMATAEEVVAQMDADGVRTSVVAGFPFADQGLCRMVNDYIVEATGRFPERLFGLAGVAPAAAGAVAELERCLDAGLKGCGELAPSGEDLGGSGRDGSSRGSEGLSAVAGCLSERGLPLLVHASEPVGRQYPGKGRFTPEACLALAGEHPALTIVFAHMGGGLFLYETMPEVRQTLARVFYDTAAVPYLYGPEVYAAALSSAGTGKFIFGSDFPLLCPARYREGIERLAPRERAAVLSENARKVYGL